jgi:hypothetical protein
MRRQGILVLALVGLTASLASCGEGEEPAVSPAPSSPAPTVRKVWPTTSPTPTIVATPVYGGSLRVGAWAAIEPRHACLEVREWPRLESPSVVSDCFPEGYVSYLTDGPVYEDELWWWRLAGLGWVIDEALRFSHEGLPWPERAELSDAGDIAFVGADGDVWIMKASGSEKRLLTELPEPHGAIVQLIWSPQGDMLALSTFRPFAVLLIDAQGEIVREIDNAVWAYWSNDGSQLTYLSDIQEQYASVSGVPMLLDLACGEARPVADRLDSAQDGLKCSPVAPLLLYARPPDIHLVDLSSGEPVERVIVPGSQGGGYLRPNWSPDGQSFSVLFRDISDGARDYYQVYSLAGERLPIRFLEKSVCGRESTHEDWQTDWTPDGRYFLYHVTCPYIDLTGGIWAVDVLENRERRILSLKGASISISPDARYFAFAVGGRPLLMWVADIDGGNPALIAEGTLPAWRPSPP